MKYTKILSTQKKAEFTFNSLPSDIIPSISKYLGDHPLAVHYDPDLYNLFFKHDEPTDYKDYIEYKEKIQNNKLCCDQEYDFTESNKTDLSYLLKLVKRKYKNIRTCEIKFYHAKYLESWEQKHLSPFKLYFYDKHDFNCLTMNKTSISTIKLLSKNESETIRQIRNKNISDLFEDKTEQKKIHQIFEELENDFKVYIKRCIAFNYKKPEPIQYSDSEDVGF